MQDTETSGAPSVNGQQQTPRRPARSKNGCLTCRRRKVRCDEQRPRCSHCERLNLQCRWRPAYTTPAVPSTTQWRFISVGGSNGNAPNGDGAAGLGHDSRLALHQQLASPDESTSHQSGQMVANATTSPSDGILGNGGIGSPLANAWLQNPGAVDQLFDYASFMWDPSGDAVGQISPETAQPGFAPTYDPNVSGRWRTPGYWTVPFILTVYFIHSHKSNGVRSTSSPCSPIQHSQQWTKLLDEEIPAFPTPPEYLAL